MNHDPEQRLDAWLGAPLASVADDGFSARVMARIERQAFPLSWLELAGIAAGALLLLLVVPFAELGDVVLRLSEQVAESVPLAMAALAITLSLVWLHATAEE